MNKTWSQQKFSVFAVEQRWARIFFGWSANRKSANSWLILQSQIRKFVMINPQMANPQISLVSQSTDRKSSNFNLQGKRQCLKLIQIRIGLS
jgi:hypothetical protein